MPKSALLPIPRPEKASIRTLKKQICAEDAHTCQDASTMHALPLNVCLSTLAAQLPGRTTAPRSHCGRGDPRSAIHCRRKQNKARVDNRWRFRGAVGVFPEIGGVLSRARRSGKTFDSWGWSSMNQRGWRWGLRMGKVWETSEGWHRCEGGGRRLAVPCDQPADHCAPAVQGGARTPADACASSRRPTARSTTGIASLSSSVRPRR